MAASTGGPGAVQSVKGPLLLQDAADLIEAVYKKATAPRAGLAPRASRPERWIEPDPSDLEARAFFDSVLTEVIQHGPLQGQIYGLQAKRRLYRDAVNVLLPEVQKAARAWALATLAKQQTRVGSLAIVVRSLSQQLHSAAEVAKKDAQKDLPVTTPEEHAEITGKTHHRNTIVVRLERAHYMQAVRGLPADPSGANKYLFYLMAHPRGVELVNRFARSADEGQEYATETISECQSAITETQVDLLTDNDLIWSFPAALAGGVRGLGFGNRPAITRFALTWATVKKGKVEAALELAGNAIMVLDLAGPIGAAAGEVLNFVLAAIGTAVSFLENVEKDQAATASAFADEAEKLSEGSRGVGTLLKGAVTIIAALGLPGTLRRVTGGSAATELVAEHVPSVRGSPDPRGLSRVEGEAVSEGEKGLGSTATSRPPGPEPIPEPIQVTPEAKAVGGEARAAGPEAQAVSAEQKAVTPEAKSVATEPKTTTPEARAAAPETTSVAPEVKKSQRPSRGGKEAKKAEPGGESLQAPEESDPRGVPRRSEETPPPSARPSRVGEAGGDSVTPRELRAEHRRALEKRIAEVRREQAQFIADGKAAEAQFREFDKKVAGAELRGRPEEAALFRAERDEWAQKAEQHGLSPYTYEERVKRRPGDEKPPPPDPKRLQPFRDEIAELQRALNGTQAQYFDALSGAASRRKAYVAIKGRGFDEVFGRVAPFEVEHLYPRSKIFATPGFEKLDWDTQVAIFNYEPNLRLMSKEANGTRGNRPYASLPQSFWVKFV